MAVLSEGNPPAFASALYDVIISGAGPVGLFLACELSLANCSVLVIEKGSSSQSVLKQLPLGLRGLNAPSIEALDRRGLLGELQAHKRIKIPHAVGSATSGSRPQAGGHFAGIQFNVAQIDTSQWRYRLSDSNRTHLLAELEEIETVLARRAEVLGVEIKRGLEVVDFQETEREVTVQCEGQSFRSKWLVGCDGGRSVVRKTGAFEFVGTEPEFTGYSALLDLANPGKLAPGRNVTETGMYLLSQPGYLILQDFDDGAFHREGKPVTLQHLQEVLRRISNTDAAISALHTATTWTDRARQATTYRKGRVLLAGDAAHIHSPLGGQGLNLGLGDAANLGWKLAATIHGAAPEGLLDSYQAERHPVGARVLDWSRAQVEIMKPSTQARALNAIFRDLMKTRDGATYFAGRVWGVATRYDLGDEHSLVGQSVPNFELEDGTKIGELMRDVRGILLDFAKNDSVERMTKDYANRVSYISSRANEQLGISSLLIRPDGIVAWVSENTVDYESLRKALGRWFVRDSEVSRGGLAESQASK